MALTMSTPVQAGSLGDFDDVNALRRASADNYEQ